MLDQKDCGKVGSNSYVCVCVCPRRALPSVCVCVSSSTIKKDRVATVQSAALISMGKRALADLSADEKERRSGSALAGRGNQRSRGEAFELDQEEAEAARGTAACKAAGKAQGRERGEAARGAEKGEGNEASAPEIIIVPVFWKGEAKQMAESSLCR